MVLFVLIICRHHIDCIFHPLFASKCLSGFCLNKKMIISFPAGAIMTLEQILELVSVDKRKMILTDSLISISQNEHPVFGFLFYHIHPCKTADVMKDVQYDNYVIR